MSEFIVRMQNGAEVIKIHLTRERDRFAGVALCWFRGDYVTWGVCADLHESADQGFETYWGRYHGENVEAAYADFYARVEAGR